MDLFFFTLTPEYVYKLMLIFCRVGTGIMLLPGIGEAYVSVRIRLLFALATSLVLNNIIGYLLPKFPGNITLLIEIIFIELLVGIFIGTIIKLISSVMSIVGMIIATASGLGSALLFDPTQEAQGAIVGNFLGMLALVLIFVTDTHHTMFKLIVDSYVLFSPGMFVQISDMNEQIVKIVSEIFLVSMKLVSAQLIISMVILLGGGIISKLIPSLQIFFLLTPIQMLVSFIILMITLPSIMYFYLNYVDGVLNNFAGVL